MGDTSPGVEWRLSDMAVQGESIERRGLKTLVECTVLYSITPRITGGR